MSQAHLRWPSLGLGLRQLPWACVSSGGGGGGGGACRCLQNFETMIQSQLDLWETGDPDLRVHKPADISDGSQVPTCG